MRKTLKFFTERGFKAFIILLICAGFAVFFIDIFLTAFALIIGGFILYDLRKAKVFSNRINKILEIEPNKIREVLVAGDKKNISIFYQMKKNLSLRILSPIKEVQIKQSELKQGKNFLEVLLSSELCGDYSIDELGVELLGPFKLIKKKGYVLFHLEMKVLPRVLVALIQASLFLLQGKQGGAGEYPSSFKGVGTEYADTREYLPGDSLRHIDWKATARHGKLMTKEFFLEAGWGAHIVYDVRSTGALSQDKLAASFLNICLGVAREGYPLEITIHDGERIFLHSKNNSSYQVLRTAMGYVLQNIKVELDDIDILIDPVGSSQIKRFLNKIKEREVKRILEFEAKVLGERVSEPYKFLMELSCRGEEQKKFLLISQLSGEIVELLQFIDEIQKHHQLTIIQPTEPWKEADDLEKAYRWYERTKKIENILCERGIKVIKNLSFLR